MARRSRSTLALVALFAAALAGLAVWFTWFAGGGADPTATARSTSGGLERRDTRRDDLAAASSGARSAASRAEQPAAPIEPSAAARPAPEVRATNAGTEPSTAYQLSGYGSIEGTLTSAGVPAADWIVSARVCPNGEERHAARTDALGRFTFAALEPARYTLVVDGPHDPETSALSAWLRPLQRSLADVSAGAAEHVDIELGGGTTVVRGRVVDQFGAPATGIHVRLRGVDASAAYDFVDVGPRESWGVNRLNITSLRGDTRDADTDPCSMNVPFVDFTTTVDERGDFVFEGLPPRLYFAEAVQQTERTILRLDEYVSEFQLARSTRYCDTSLLADWDAGDFLVIRRIPFELVVHFVDETGTPITADHHCSKAWCLAGNLSQQFGVPVRDGPQRIAFVNETRLDMESESHTYSVVVSLDDVPIATTSFDLRDVLVLPQVDGKRVHEITLTLR